MAASNWPFSKVPIWWNHRDLAYEGGIKGGEAFSSREARVFHPLPLVANNNLMQFLSILEAAMLDGSILEDEYRRA